MLQAVPLEPDAAQTEIESPELRAERTLKALQGPRSPHTRYRHPR